MNRDRWAIVDRLLDEALARAPGERAAFLIEACNGDDSLQREVASLLAAHEKADGWLAQPAMQVAAQKLAQMPSLTGKKLGPYQVIELLGAGGMGEVYLARDGRLERKVALKLLPRTATQDADRLQRFAREARSASALNHPNIITIYDIGEQDATHFIAAEFVDGQTLRALCGRALPVKDVLEIGMQIAAALAAAHEAGIIHRDIKPENVMLRRDGYVKVLDFGLAKLSAPPSRTTGNTQPDLGRTQPGVILGTVRYMSPEQALGEQVDHRTDIFSLGVVLYELLAGAPPFKGVSAMDTLDAIIHHAPTALPEIKAELPVELWRIIERALEKDRDLRYQTAADLRADLKRLQRELDSSEIQHHSQSGQMLAAPRANRRLWLWALVGLVALLLTGGGFWWWRNQAVKFSAGWNNAVSLSLTDVSDSYTFVNLSPDGKDVIYVRVINGQSDIFQQRIGASKAINLTPNNKTSDSMPSYSPDGSLIAFRSERDGGGLFLMGASGENVRRLTSSGYNPSWSPDGKQVIYATCSSTNPQFRYAVDCQLEAVEIATGATRRIPASRDIGQPRWSPNGHRIAYWGIHNGTQRDIWTIPASGGTPVAVTDDKFVDATPVWSADGTELYFISNRGGRTNLWRIAIDERTGKTYGEPELVPAPSSFTLQPNLSRDGKLLVYESCVFNENIQRIAFDTQKARVSGSPEWVTEGMRRASDPSLSPDGQWVAYYTYSDPQQDIFVRKTDRSEERQLTKDVFRDFMPRWSPLGDRIAFFSDASGRYEIYTMNPDGSGRQQISHSPDNSLGYIAPVWSPDARRMAITLRGSGGSVLFDLTLPWQSQTPQPLPPLPVQPGYFFAIAWSPDGQRLVGTHWTQEGEKQGVWLYDLSTQRYEQLTTEGKDPVWFQDSRRVLYHLVNQPSVWIVDSVTKERRKIYEAAPELSIGAAMLSHDEKMLYTVTGQYSSSIHMLQRP